MVVWPVNAHWNVDGPSCLKASALVKDALDLYWGRWLGGAGNLRIGGIARWGLSVWNWGEREKETYTCRGGEGGGGGGGERREGGEGKRMCIQNITCTSHNHVDAVY